MKPQPQFTGRVIDNPTHARCGLCFAVCRAEVSHWTGEGWLCPRCAGRVSVDTREFAVVRAMAASGWAVPGRYVLGLIAERDMLRSALEDIAGEEVEPENAKDYAAFILKEESWEA